MANNGREHSYRIAVRWTGNQGNGTSSSTGYRRDHEVQSGEKPPIPASSDPAFRGDRLRYNPEEMLVAALSSCHMLWYLHLCADARVVVAYTDDAKGTMIETSDGGGRFTAVELRPRVVIEASSDPKVAGALHEKAHHLCFIANSVNFPVRCEPMIEVAKLVGIERRTVE